MTRAAGRGAVGLRQIVAVTALALAFMTIGVSGGLVVLTTSLQHTSRLLREAVRGARLARVAQVDLMLHNQAAERHEQDRLEGHVREILGEDFGFPQSSAVALPSRDAARRSIEHYFATAHDDNSSVGDRTTQLGDALGALEPLAAAGVANADVELARAAHYDRLGNAIGVIATLLMIGVLAIVILWTRNAVVRPMLSLSRAMDRFRHGDLTARATPSGAAELRRVMDQFNSMGESLARQNEARLANLAGVAHDLRNPLSALQLSAALVDPDQPLPSESTIRRTLALVRRQVSRLNRMVEDLLDATRIEAGHLALELHETDLRNVVSDVAALFNDVTTKHTLRADLPDEPVVARCDAQRIEQTLSNLVSNAIKYSPRGGTVTIRAYLADGEATISVADEGIGMSSPDLDHIWAPFARRGASTGAIAGAGLGLWTAKRIANAHHGDIRVESTLGKGSTFLLVLPLNGGVTEAGAEIPGQEAVESPEAVLSARAHSSHA